MRAAAIVMLSAGAASAAPLAHLDQDVDGDGKVDHVSVEATGLVIEAGTRTTLPLAAGTTRATIAFAQVNGVPTLAVTVMAAGGEQTFVFEQRAAWAAVMRESTGPVGADGDYAIAIGLGANGIYRYQQRAGIRRCDGKPAYLFGEGWKDKKFRRLAKLPTDVADAAPVLAAKPDPQPAIAPLLYQARAASYEPGAENASALAIPSELDDGSPATFWHEELSTIGEGQFFTFEPRTGTARATELRIQAAAAKGFERARRIAVVGAGGKAWHVELADSDAAQTIDLPEPISGCVTVVIEAAHGSEHGKLAIGELSVYGEGERAGGGEAGLARVIAEGGDIKAATQALARRGAAGASALDAELQKATSAGARSRLVLALATIRDPSVGPLLAHAIEKGKVEDRDLDAVLAALGAQGFAQELHDLVAKRELAVAHRAAAATALAAAIATTRQADATLLVDLAGDGPREVRKAVIDGLSHAPVPTLVAAAQTATAPEAAGDLWRAVTRRARTTPAEAAPALAAFVAALAAPGATDYERRYRIVDGLASLGDAHALGALATLLRGLPAGSARAAFDQVAAQAIAKAPRPEALDLLLFFMTEPDPGVRYAALTALGATESGPGGAWHAAVGADGVDRVIQTALASDTWPEVRSRAAQMLGARCARPGPAKSLGDAVHRDPELAVRVDALGALVECKAPGTADLLAKTWDNRKQPLELRQRAIDLAVELGDRGLAGTLLTRLGQWRGAALESTEALALAQNAAYAVGRLAPPGAAEALLAALDDGAFPEVVAAGATGLGLMGRACPAEARTKLRALAHSDDQQIQLAASHAAALCGK